MNRTSYWKPTSKFRNVRQTYNGVNFHSKAEAQVAAELDLRVRAGDILGYDRQFKCDLTANGKHIANYYCDFRLHLIDGSYELLEVKGWEGEVYRLKRKLLEAVWLPEHPDHVYTIYKV